MIHSFEFPTNAPFAVKTLRFPIVNGRGWQPSIIIMAILLHVNASNRTKVSNSMGLWFGNVACSFFLHSYLVGLERRTTARFAYFRLATSVDSKAQTRRTFRRAYSTRKLCNNAYIVVPIQCIFIVIMIDWSMFWGLNDIELGSIIENGNGEEWGSLKAIVARVLDSPSVNCVFPSSTQNARLSILLTHRHFGLVPTNQPFTYGYYDEWQ